MCVKKIAGPSKVCAYFYSIRRGPFRVPGLCALHTPVNEGVTRLSRQLQINRVEKRIIQMTFRGSINIHHNLGIITSLEVESLPSLPMILI